MKKYITTDKNMYLREGHNVVLNKYIYNNQIQKHIEKESHYWNLGEKLFDDWLEKGYIKEVEKPEFTKSDMIDLLEYDEEHGMNLLYHDVA